MIPHLQTVANVSPGIFSTLRTERLGSESQQLPLHFHDDQRNETRVHIGRSIYAQITRDRLTEWQFALVGLRLLHVIG